MVEFIVCLEMMKIVLLPAGTRRCVLTLIPPSHR